MLHVCVFVCITGNGEVSLAAAHSPQKSPLALYKSASDGTPYKEQLGKDQLYIKCVCVSILSLTVSEISLVSPNNTSTDSMKKNTNEVPTSSPKTTPTKSDKVGTSTMRTLPRKLQSPQPEEKKSKPTPKYGGFTGFGLSYSSPKSPISPSSSSPETTQRTPTPDSTGQPTKSPEPPVKSVVQKCSEPPSAKETGSVKVEDKKEPNKLVKEEVKKTDSSGGGDSWRERLKERKRQRELEREQEEREKQQREKEREQRAKEREERYNTLSKSIKNKEETTTIKKDTPTTTPTTALNVSVSPTPSKTSPSPLSPAKVVSSRSTEDKSKKSLPKYGGFTGFGVSYGSPKTKTPSPSPEPFKTQAPAPEKPVETIKDPSPSPKPSKRQDPAPEKPVDTIKIDSSKSSTEVVKKGHSVHNGVKHEDSKRDTADPDEDLSSTSSSSVSSNSSSSSSTSLYRGKRGRQSDAGVSYYSSSKTKDNADNASEKDNKNILRNNHIKEKEESPVISHGDERWSDKSINETHEEKARIREDLELKQEQSQNVVRRRYGANRNRTSKDQTFGAFYRRRSRLFDSEDSSGSKSPTPIHQGSSLSPVPIRSPSPKPHANLSSDSSSTSVETTPPSFTKQEHRKSPLSLTPPQQIHFQTGPSEDPSTIKNSPKTRRISQEKLVSPTLDSTPEEPPQPPPPPKESPNTIHTWKQPPPPGQQDADNRLRHLPEENGHFGGPNRIAQQKIKMMALMADEETMIEANKVEVNRIQPKKEVC